MRDEPLLILGDCREKLEGLPHVDAVVTDPPYGVELKEFVTKHTRRKAEYESTDDSEESILPLVLEVVQKCRALASVVVLTSGTRLLQKYPIADEIGTIFFSNGAGRSTWGFGCNNPILYYGKCPYLKAGLGSRPNSVSATHWNRRKNAEHPCEKPLKMMKWLVERASLPGQTILDPFMGSGTTGVACILLGRKFIGIEKEPKYFAIAQKRIADALGRPVEGKKKEGLLW